MEQLTWKINSDFYEIRQYFSEEILSHLHKNIDSHILNQGSDYLPSLSAMYSDYIFSCAVVSSKIYIR